MLWLRLMAVALHNTYIHMKNCLKHKSRYFIQASRHQKYQRSRNNRSDCDIQKIMMTVRYTVACGFLYIWTSHTKEQCRTVWYMRELEQEKRNSFPAWFILPENECVIDIFSVYVGSSTLGTIVWWKYQYAHFSGLISIQLYTGEF